MDYGRRVFKQGTQSPQRYIEKRVTNCKTEVKKINLELSEISEKYKISDLAIEVDFDASLAKIAKRIQEFWAKKQEI